MYKPSIIRESSAGFSAITLEDQLFAGRKVFLTDAVTPESTDAVLKQLMVLRALDPQNEITLYINSPGGDVQSGLALYDYMNLIDTPIRTVCIGGAASMGAILFLAGDTREMLPSSTVMIHDPSFGNGAAFAGLKPRELEERLEDLKRSQGVLCRIIAERCGKTLEEVMEKTKKDSEFNADEALKYGLCTKILEASDL